VYQRERFPLARYAPLIAVFTFSAAAYSRLIRGSPGFIRAEIFAAGAWTALTFFFLLRVLDEHKDAALDRRYRSELPVPRGLVTLAELRWIGGLALASTLLGNALIAPVLLWTCLAIGVWTALMTKEFFMGAWLRAHPTAYLLSHMSIMPIVDGYTTGLDWLVAGAHPQPGLGLFLLVTYLNGTVLEIGRKLRAPRDEREGVESYTHVWGMRAAPIVWLAVLLAAAVTAGLAAHHTGAATVTVTLLAPLWLVTAIPALCFLKTRHAAWAARVEAASGLWVLALYLLLGTGPFIARWLGR
jgi:4-hydroxybenzoate polyprenyltransferase